MKILPYACAALFLAVSSVPAGAAIFLQIDAPVGGPKIDPLCNLPNSGCDPVTLVSKTLSFVHQLDAEPGNGPFNISGEVDEGWYSATILRLDRVYEGFYMVHTVTELGAFSYPVEVVYKGYDFGVRVVVPAAVPEPATWAMMILGLGLVGSAVRRTKNAALA